MYTTYAPTKQILNMIAYTINKCINPLENIISPLNTLNNN